VSLVQDLRVWLLVVAVSALGSAAALTFYYAGKQGTEAVFARFPTLKPQMWERVHALFARYGSWVLLVSFIPGVGAVLEAAAGAFGTATLTFLIFVMAGRLIRNTAIVLVIELGLSLLG
jgi:membrane protein YqaA with SNARE-associated domain